MRLDLAGHRRGSVLTGRSDPSGIADFYLGRGAALVVIKLGEKGSFMKNRDKEMLILAAKVPAVVDTVGAGDGFAVGLISALLEGLPADQAAWRGNQIAALVIQQIGDSEGLPTREQIFNK
jgi:2-dehydro-3-deoxygluconokinase